MGGDLIDIIENDDESLLTYVADISGHGMQQFPLGLIPGGRYASQEVSYLPGDIFLLLTDCISEVVNERDEEFGLAPFGRLLSQYAAQPLPDLGTGHARGRATLAATR